MDINFGSKNKIKSNSSIFFTTQRAKHHACQALSYSRSSHPSRSLHAANDLHRNDFFHKNWNNTVCSFGYVDVIISGLLDVA